MTKVKAIQDLGAWLVLVLGPTCSSRAGGWGPNFRGPCYRKGKQLRGLGGWPWGMAPESRTPAQFPRRIRNMVGQSREHSGPTGSQFMHAFYFLPTWHSLILHQHRCQVA